MKIISGGQSGADLGGIDFAKKYGIECEMNAFEGFKPVRDNIPTDVHINYVCFKPTYNSNLVCRTIYNVLNSDLTLILVNKPIERTKGSLLTYNTCIKNKKPMCLCDINIQYDIVRHFLKKFNISNSIINIAGERVLERNNVVEYLERVFDDYIELKL